MNSHIPSPQNRLSKDAVKVWIISGVIENVIGFIILAFLFYLDHLFLWKEWIGWILIGVAGISVLLAVGSFIKPFLLYKTWCYEVDEEFLQLKYGALNEKHQLIPMTKIQSVATTHGPLLRRYGLYSVSVETMASSYTIPALPKETAIELRNQIAQLAKVKEVES